MIAGDSKCHFRCSSPNASDINININQGWNKQPSHSLTPQAQMCSKSDGRATCQILRCSCVPTRFPQRESSSQRVIPGGGLSCSLICNAINQSISLSLSTPPTHSKSPSVFRTLQYYRHKLVECSTRSRSHPCLCIYLLLVPSSRLLGWPGHGPLLLDTKHARWRRNPPVKTRQATETFSRCTHDIATYIRLVIVD